MPRHANRRICAADAGVALARRPFTPGAASRAEGWQRFSIEPAARQLYHAAVLPRALPAWRGCCALPGLAHAPPVCDELCGALVRSSPSAVEFDDPFCRCPGQTDRAERWLRCKRIFDGRVGQLDQDAQLNFPKAQGAPKVNPFALSFGIRHLPGACPRIKGPQEPTKSM